MIQQALSELAEQAAIDRAYRASRVRVARKSAGILPLIALLALSGASAKAIELTDTAFCTAQNRPWDCCSGPAAGNCDGKAEIRTSVKAWTVFESCAVEWFDGNGALRLCNEIRFGIQWHVDAGPGTGSGACSQAEADAATPLPVVTCTTARQTAGKCRAPFEGSTKMPAQAACFKARGYLEKKEIKGPRKAGRKLWKLADDGGAFDPGDEEE